MGDWAILAGEPLMLPIPAPTAISDPRVTARRETPGETRETGKAASARSVSIRHGQAVALLINHLKDILQVDYYYFQCPFNFVEKEPSSSRCSS